MEESKKESPAPATLPPLAAGGSSAKTESAKPRPSAVTIRDALIPALMQMAAGGHAEIDGATFRAYRDALVWEAKSHDVLEQVLLEQVALAHLATFQLQANAGVAKTPEAAGIYATAAAKLMGEIRRTIVAFKELRSPPPSPSTTIATTQQVNMSGSVDGSHAEEKSSTRSEVGSNHAPGQNRLREILGEGLGRAEEPAVAGAAD